MVNPFDDDPTVIYKEGDEVKLEYRDPGRKWVADVALVNKGVVRYIFEIKNTHATTTARPEPWFEIDALALINDINTLQTEIADFERSSSERWIYTISCVRKDIVRYCCGSFCHLESWVEKIPKCNEGDGCILCEAKDYSPAYVCGNKRVCLNCLFADIYKKRLRSAYAPKCHGNCFIIDNVGRYTQKKCPDKCKLQECPKCKSPVKYPEYFLLSHGGTCVDCDIRKTVCILIDVPFARKDEAKAMGAKWDSLVKKWYIFKDAKNKTTVLSKFKEVK